MRVAIITASIYEKERPMYTEINRRRLEFYCRIRGYDLFYINKNLANIQCARSKYKWQGFIKLRQLIKEGNYDAYVWVDDDIFVCNINKKNRRFLQK